MSYACVAVCCSVLRTLCSVLQWTSFSLFIELRATIPHKWNTTHHCVVAVCSVCCSLLQSVAVCCSLLAVCCSVLRVVIPPICEISLIYMCKVDQPNALLSGVYVAVCFVVCCSVFQRVAVCCSLLQSVAVCCSLLQSVAVCCSALQSVAVCCSLLQCCYMVFHVVVCMHIVYCRVMQCVAVCWGVTCLTQIWDMTYSYVWHDNLTCSNVHVQNHSGYHQLSHFVLDRHRRVRLRRWDYVSCTAAHCNTLQHTATYCNTN